MKKSKLILMILFILLLATFINAGKCWYVKEFTSETNPNFDWAESSPEGICIDGECWNRVLFSNSSLTISGFGAYNKLCDNGVSNYSKNFGVLKIKQETSDSNDPFEKTFTNVSGNGPAVSISLNYCYNDSGQFNIPPCTLYAPDCPVQVHYARSYAAEEVIGAGNINEINFIVRNEFESIAEQLDKTGGYSMDFSLMRTPIAGTYGSTPIQYLKNDSNFYFAPPPSVFILPLGDDTVGFYEKNGDYVKEVYYTIKAQTYLDLEIKDFELTCPSEITCEVFDAQNEYVMTKENDILIVGARITVPKENIPKKITYKLNLKYDIRSLKDLGPEYKDINISSNLSILNMGYLDKQEFQVNIIGRGSSESCVGYNGLIGSTGSSVAPRINVNTNFEDGFDGNICSPENENWVYCSQRETLAILANKIVDLFNLYYSAEQETDANRKNQIYSQINDKKSFEIYIRNVDFSDLNTVLPEQEDLFTINPFDLGGDTQTENIKRAKNLFNEVTFLNSGQGISIDKKYSVGKYNISIDMFSQNSSGSLNSSQANSFSSNTIFDLSGNIIDPDILNIQIDFISDGGEPLLNWFFYEEGVESITDQITPEILSVKESQIDKRGQVMYFNQSLTNLDVSDIKVYPSYAIPLFVKVDKNQTSINNKLILKNINAPNEINELENNFSYWTGFASSLKNGCGEILTSESALVYRFEDEIKSEDGATNTFSVNLYSNLNSENFENGKEYLQTVIYAPLYAASNAFSAELLSNNTGTGQNLFAQNVNCDEGDNCTLEIKQDNSQYLVSFYTSIPDIIQGIKDEEICVNYKQSGTNDLTEWTLFWNEEEIIREELRGIKYEVLANDSDSRYCDGLFNQRN